jgi:hypothetical protein
MVALDQQTGGHAIVAVDEDAGCPALAGSFGTCPGLRLDLFPLLPDGPLTPGDLIEQAPGRTLSLAAVTEPDVDRDLAGDRTEDRTDLRVAGSAYRTTAGLIRLTARIRNTGPREASLTTLAVSPAQKATASEPFPPGTPTAPWQARCMPSNPLARRVTSAGSWSPAQLPQPGELRCSIGKLAPGEWVTVDVSGYGAMPAQPLRLQALAEGPVLRPEASTASVPVEDLALRDEPPRPVLPARPVVRVTTATKHRISRWSRVRVKVDRPGTAKVTVATRVRGRPVRYGRSVGLGKATLTRTVTIRPRGAVLRKLRGAVGRRGKPATLTVSFSSNEGERRTVTRRVRIVR